VINHQAAAWLTITNRSSYVSKFFITVSSIVYFYYFVNTSFEIFSEFRKSIVYFYFFVKII